MYQCKYQGKIVHAYEIMDDFELERQFRTISLKYQLYCNECGETVYYKHGDIRKAYFAHKKGAECDYNQFCKYKQESIRLDSFRNSLFQHLQQKYPNAKIFERSKRFGKHYCDLIVENDDQVSYIEIIEEYMQPRYFDYIYHQYKNQDQRVIWIVCGKVLDVISEKYYNHVKRFLNHFEMLIFWDYETQQFTVSKVYQDKKGDKSIIKCQYFINHFSIDIEIFPGFQTFFLQEVELKDQIYINQNQLEYLVESKQQLQPKRKEYPIRIGLKVFHYYGSGVIIDLNEINNAVTVLFTSGKQKNFYYQNFWGSFKLDEENFNI